MFDLAKVLSSRGHALFLLYFYRESARVHHETALRQIDALARDSGGIDARAIADDRGADKKSVRATGQRNAGKKDALSKGRRLSPSRSITAWLRRRRFVAMLPRWLRTGVGSRLERWLAVRSPRTFLVAIAFTLLPRDLYSVLVAGAEVIPQYVRSLRFFRQFVRNERVDAILIPEDIVGGLWPVSIKAGHDCGVPTLVLPYTLANRDEPLQSLRDQRRFQLAGNRLAAWLFPRWRMRAPDGPELVRLPTEHIVAHEVLGITPPDPWMMNSGFSDAICVDSRASFDYFRAGGIPEAQMEITGSVSQDAMYELRRDKAARRAEICAQLGLSGDKPLLLVSGCPNQLAAKVPFCEFESLEAIAAFVGATLQPLGERYHLVVRPHPNFIEFGAMLEAYGFSSTTVPTSRLVPISDLFVAFASATIRWAIACAVPTINYDVFHYGYGDFAKVSGVLSMQKKREFVEAVGNLVPGDARYAALSREIAASSAYWAMMDGRCAERIESVIERECSRARAGREAPAR
jgi:hypothetical protein